MDSPPLSVSFKSCGLTHWPILVYGWKRYFEICLSTDVYIWYKHRLTIYPDVLTNISWTVDNELPSFITCTQPYSIPVCTARWQAIALATKADKTASLVSAHKNTTSPSAFLARIPEADWNLYPSKALSKLILMVEPDANLLSWTLMFLPHQMAHNVHKKSHRWVMEHASKTLGILETNDPLFPPFHTEDSMLCSQDSCISC